MNEENLMDDFGSPAVFYSKFYKSVIFGKGIGPRSVRKTHESMEKPFSGKHFSRVLEVGGGIGEHLDFILHDFDEYLLTDVKLPILGSKFAIDPRVVCQVENAEYLTFPDNSFDRVISTCLLHHVYEPEKVFEEILRVLKIDGVATIFLPCDPGLLVRLLRNLTTAKNAKKSGFKGYNLMISREHRNHFMSLLHMAKYVFREKKLRVRYFPFRIPSWNLNGYVIVQVS
jgi:phosphatidylethanolamine/phosphatidyl-N-methylethanolamine N-methyltransferase